MQASKLRGLFSGKLSWLIIIITVNAVVFLGLRITSVIFNLSGFPEFEEAVLHRVELPADFHEWLSKPWTLVTYMFCQYDAWHIVFNMLMLYWAGQLFTFRSGSRRLAMLYVAGGMLGAVVFMTVSALAPGLSAGAYLTGSSASVFAVMTATAFIMPKTPVLIPLIGRIQLRWIVIGIILLDLCLGSNGENVGGHVAHLGGVIAGAIYPLVARLLATRHLKDTKKRDCADTDDARNLDAILDKIKRSGYASLTAGERKQLFDISNRIK